MHGPSAVGTKLATATITNQRSASPTLTTAAAVASSEEAATPVTDTAQPTLPAPPDWVTPTAMARALRAGKWSPLGTPLLGRARFAGCDRDGGVSGMLERAHERRKLISCAPQNREQVHDEACHDAGMSAQH